MDVNLISKDMELNFSNRNDDDDELETKANAGATLEKEGDDLNQDDERSERFGVEE